jgi:uncharacterized protein YabE (DUF348 family)
MLRLHSFKHPHINLRHLEENETQLLAYADDVNLLGKDTNIMTNKESLLDANKEADIKQEQRKPVQVSLQTAGQNHTIKMLNKFIQNVDNFKYLRMIAANQN